MSSWSDTDLNETELLYVNAIVSLVKDRYKFVGRLTKIFNHLYLGSQGDALDKKTLKRLGITHILNTVDGTTGCLTYQGFYSDELKYLGFKTEDQPNYPIMDHFDKTYKFIEDARTTGGKCLIHCMAGVNRSGALAVGYAMVHNNIGPVSATRLVIDVRGLLLSNPGFIERLVRFAADRNLLTLDANEIGK